MGLYGVFLRRLVLSKRSLFFAVLPFTVSLLALIPDIAIPPADFFRQYAAFIFLSSVGVFLPMYFGTRSFGEEIEGRTIAYLLTRPRGRGEILLAKSAASATASASFLVPPALVCALAFSGGDPGGIFEPAALLCGVLVAASLVYTAFFQFFGIVLKRPIVVGVIVTFGWENFISYLPGTFKDLTVMRFLQAILIRSYGIPKYLNIPVEGEVPGLDTSLIVCVSILAVSLLLSWLALRRKEFI